MSRSGTFAERPNAFSERHGDLRKRGARKLVENVGNGNKPWQFFFFWFLCWIYLSKDSLGTFVACLIDGLSAVLNPSKSFVAGIQS